LKDNFFIQKDKKVLTARLNNYTIDACVRDNAVIFESKQERKNMNFSANHSYQLQAKQAGFMPTYWSAIESNDRTPEIVGSQETKV